MSNQSNRRVSILDAKARNPHYSSTNNLLRRTSYHRREDEIDEGDAEGDGNTEEIGKDSKGYSTADESGSSSIRTWAPPSSALSRLHASRKIWLNGKRPLKNLKIKDLEGLGLGLVLYFELMHQLTILFGILSLIAVPMLVVNYDGNDDKAMKSVDVDLLSLSKFTLGNQGVDVDANLMFR